MVRQPGSRSFVVGDNRPRPKSRRAEFFFPFTRDRRKSKRCKKTMPQPGDENKTRQANSQKKKGSSRARRERRFRGLGSKKSDKKGPRYRMQHTIRVPFQ